MATPPRFLLDQPLTGPGEYVLGRLEAHHARQVLRLGRGDAVVVFDGRGGAAEAEITGGGRGELVVTVTEVRTGERPPLRLTVATAIPKGKRWQMLVEKCTELGVDRIQPLLTERSVARGEGDGEKWRRWVVEAAKQCRRLWLPEVASPISLADFLHRSREDGARLVVADPGGEAPAAVLPSPPPALAFAIVIGPEGGLTDAEVAACRAAGARLVRLGPFVLRVETAAAAACALIRGMGL
ncbi:MAG: 16S rRNA (uracil(1498)-N(3))-methyltransferase [Planctomycetes bacterium]|nr:16S rRNA (uracil(1498)-N(3))-methyltransferase [Planctomycetota bacterium]